MSVESTFSRFDSLNRSIGKRALNALFPNDIELYVISLELVNSSKQTEGYFVFPINPSSINEPLNPIQSIKKTAGGVTTMNTTTFTPSDITLQGNFGRKFKFLLGKEVLNFSALKFTPSISKPTFAQEFDASIKTGYGCCKVLESIIKKSNTLDSNGQPYALYFYNLALGNSYLIKATSINFYQNQESNMIWNYNLTIKSLINVEDVTEDNQNSLTQSLSANSAIQDRVNSIGNSTSRLTSNFGKTVVGFLPI